MDVVTIITRIKSKQQRVAHLQLQHLRPGHDYDKKRRERVMSRILLLMARPGQTTGPLFRPVGEAVEMECMQAFREEWGSCVEDGFEGLAGQARRALPLDGAACDGTSGRAVGRAGDAIWWALHGLRCSSGAYAHI